MRVDQASLWLAEPRFARFVEAAGGDHSLAIELYEWHAELSSASFITIHLFEVLARNAIDRTLGDGQPEEPLRNTWMMDFSVLRPERGAERFDPANAIDPEVP